MFGFSKSEKIEKDRRNIEKLEQEDASWKARRRQLERSGLELPRIEAEKASKVNRSWVEAQQAFRERWGVELYRQHINSWYQDGWDI